MIKSADKTKYYKYKRELGQNPNIGFVSFQSFRGDPLYSDCIMHPENNFTETEHFECYPRPDYVEEKGDKQGFFPDTSIAYIRVLWKEWETEQGIYNYEFIEEIIHKAKEKNQTIMFRLMPHSTRACDDVPDWLKNLIPCPLRPDGKRVKESPTDPLFLKLFGEAVRKLGERFDSEPVFDMVDISLTGAWGEGSDLEKYSKEDLEQLVDIYISNFTHTRLICQFIRPDLVRRVAEKNSVGIRADGFGNNMHMYEIYPPRFEELSDVWKVGPVSFEALRWLGEWKRLGWDLDEIIQMSLKWHISSFNAKSLPIPFEWRAKIDYWVSKMGYHFVIDYFKFPSTAQSKDELELKIGIDNIGVAPMYDKNPFYVKLSGKKEYTFKTDIDVTEWLPGKNAEKFSINLPENIEPEKYNIMIGVNGQNYPLVYFATDALLNDGFYNVGEITIN